MEQRKKYEEEKLDITKRVSQVMDLAINPIFGELDNETVEFMQKLYGARRKRAQNGGRLRDIVVLTILKICGTKEISLDHLKAIAAGEFYNIASYYQNWHLDNKKEVENEKQAKLCHIASHVAREIAHRLIIETNFSENIKLSLLKEISDSNMAIQIGQAFELNELNIENNDIINGKQKAIENYFRRTLLITGKFYGSSFAMGAIMAEAGVEEVKLFREIGENFGTGAQIINDAGDFCLNKEIAKHPDKDYKDQFRDLEKGTITLPILELSRFIALEKYTNRKISNEEKEMLLGVMIKNRCFDSARQNSNFLRNKMIKLLSNIRPSAERAILEFMIKTFFNSNKFYVNLREEYGYVWGK
ncbi:MAG: polyprenyl synthetase family protein [Nanoarchaeota archaeon]